MKIAQSYLLTAAIAAGLAATAPCAFASEISPKDARAQMVVTVERSGAALPEALGAKNITVTADKTPMPVMDVQRLEGSLAGMQLYILLDDSSGAASLGIHLPEVAAFIKALPATTQVGVGYMWHGTFSPAQAFTTNHELAAKTLRLPESIPSVNGSPYFALADLAKHWPSKEATGRRAVLMLTNGVDEYYRAGLASTEDPYVDEATQAAQKAHAMVYAIYIRGAFGPGPFDIYAQAHLTQVTEETGGVAYGLGLGSVPSIQPYLRDLSARFESQYEVTFGARNEHGAQFIKLQTNVPGATITGPSRVYVD